MTKEFIPYEQALELKKLGFDEPCLSYYEGESFSYHLATMTSGDDYIIPAPLFQQAFRWFREKYMLYLHIVFIEKGWHWDVYHLDRGLVTQPELKYYHSYEEAELACLRKLIELIKQNQ